MANKAQNWRPEEAWDSSAISNLCDVGRFPLENEIIFIFLTAKLFKSTARSFEDFRSAFASNKYASEKMSR